MAVALLALVACRIDTTPPTAPHTGLAANLLNRPGYEWATHAFTHGHIHFLPGSHAAANTNQITHAVDSVRQRVLEFLSLPEVGDERVEVFFVDSRAQMQALLGRPMGGMVQSGEPTAVLVYNAEFAPFLLHELTHLYTHYRWGPPRNGRWLSEGIAMLVSGDCQGHSIHDLVKALHEEGKLIGWQQFVRDFDRLDELSANPQAGSMVAYLRSEGGNELIRDLWTSEGWTVLERRLRKPTAEIEQAWQQRVRVTGRAAHLDMERLLKEGCRS